MPQLSVLFIGQLDDGVPPYAAHEMAPGCTTDWVPDVHAAMDYLRQGRKVPSVLVLAESRPGEISHASVHELRKFVPLARIWRLLGSWCEGERRSGKPPSGCTSSYWHQWRPKAAREIASALGGRCPTWGLPATATADEQVLDSLNATQPNDAGLIVILAPHAATAAALADACHAGGYSTLIAPPEDRWSLNAAKAVLWDLPASEIDADQFQALRASAGETPIFAILNFPRAEDGRRAAEMGLAGVISKPFLLADLLWHFERAENVAP